MHESTIQLGEFCRLLQVSSREGKYVLEQGCVPKGIDKAPATGNHRRFSAGQAFWLGMVVKIKQSGIRLPLAAEIASHADQCLRGITQNLGWDWRFRPVQGEFDTDHQYLLQIGDSKYVRILSDANPSMTGLHEFDWQAVKSPGKPVADFRPFVIVQVDLSRIAAALKVGEWS